MDPKTPFQEPVESPGDSRDDFVSRLALRLVSPPEVIPRLGLRFAPTPDLPDEDSARWRAADAAEIDAGSEPR